MFTYVDYVANNYFNVKPSGTVPCNLTVTISGTTIAGNTISLGAGSIKKGSSGTIKLSISSTSAVLNGNPYISEFYPSNYYDASTMTQWKFMWANSSLFG